MPNRKVSDFDALTTVDAEADFIPVVDVSDTTQAVSGTTKKVTLKSLLLGFVNSIGTSLTAPLLPDTIQVGSSADPANVYRLTFENMLNRPAQATDASNPGAGRLQAFTKNVAARPLMGGIGGPTSRAYAYQPAFFSSYFGVVTPAVTTTVNVLGCAVTSVGTLSHPTVTQVAGYMTNFASAASANATAGTGFNQVAFSLGDGSGLGGGFFYNARLYFPDASYDESGASTGKRLFAGLTSGTLAASVASDDPAGEFAGFVRFHVNGGLTHTNWFFATKDGATLNLVDTGVPFTPQNVYDFFIYSGRASGVVNWRIDNVNSGATASNSTSTNLPVSTTQMRPGFQALTVNAVAINVRMQRVYCESDV